MVETMMTDYYRRFEWKGGIPADFWVVRELEVGRFIKENNISAVSRRSLGVPKEVSPERMVDIDYIMGIQGGRRVPHLHYKGDLYLLKAKQWREFSGAVVKDLSKRLAKSRQVNFTELLEISDSVGAASR
jgi:hypothetical protein